jgi:hypothetical protein
VHEQVGVGKTLHCNIVWLGLLPTIVDEAYLQKKLSLYGRIDDVIMDTPLRQAVVTYAQVDAACEAVRSLKLKKRTIAEQNPAVDYGSTQLHDLFLDRQLRCVRACTHM